MLDSESKFRILLPQQASSGNKFTPIAIPPTAQKEVPDPRTLTLGFWPRLPLISILAFLSAPRYIQNTGLGAFDLFSTVKMETQPDL